MDKSQALRSFAVFVLFLIVIAVAGVFITGGFTSASTTDSGPTGTLYVAPDGSDGSPCSEARPCASFDRAYQVASPGDSVVATCPGTSCAFPDQTIASSSAKPLRSTCRWGARFQDRRVAQNLSGCIHFMPDPAKTVTVSNVSINAPYVYLDGFTLSGPRDGNNGNIDIQNRSGADGGCTVPNSFTDIIVRNVKAYGFFLQGVQFTSFVNDVFDAQMAISNTVTPCNQSPHPYDTNHILFDGVTVKNVYWNAAGQHVEGIHWWDGDQVLITNSRFLNDAQFDINFDGDRGNLTHITVQNTIFDATCSHQTFPGGCQAAQNNGGHAVSMNNRVTSFQTANNIFAFNSFPLNDWPSFTSAGNMSNIRVYGSVMEGPQNAFSCDSLTTIGVTFDYNVFNSNQLSPTRCGPTNSIGNSARSLYTDPANYDYSLKRGSRPIGFVPTSQPRPAVDINGDPRPSGFKADAGADQWDSSVIGLSGSVGHIRIGGSVDDVLAFYGQPRSHTKVTVNHKRLDRLAFSLHRGSLWLLADRAAVVGIGTTTPYYATRAGMGVGATVTALRPLGRLTWVECRHAFKRDVGGVGVFITLAGGRQGSRISSLSMVKRSYSFGSCIH